MTPVVKNILTLIFFIIFFSWIGRAEAIEGHGFDSMEQNFILIMRSGPESNFINKNLQEKCELRYWTWCVYV